MSSLNASAPTNGALDSTYRSLLNNNQTGTCFLEGEACALVVSCFCISLPHIHRILLCVRMCIYVTVYVCVHVSFLNTRGEVEHCFNACKMGLWEAPSFIADMTENLDWEKDLRVKKCITNTEIVRIYSFFFHGPPSSPTTSGMICLHFPISPISS